MISFKEKEIVTIYKETKMKGGQVRAITSKSHAHRLLIASKLSDSPVQILTNDTSKDIEATKNCLNQLFSESSQLDCGESGSTLRFIIPIIGALGKNAEITMHGRLSERPLSPMYEELEKHGLTMSPQGTNPFSVSGQLSGGKYEIAGNISSQFITGLLFALPLLKEDSTLHVTGKLESRPYVDMTLDVLKTFGIVINEAKNEKDESVFTIKGSQVYHSDHDIIAEGDWSNAAFFLAAGAIGDSPVTVTGLNTASLQGDKSIVSLLENFGAGINIENDASKLSSVTISPKKLCGIDIDASQIPDLVPILSVVAACAEGKTTIRNIERLRIKESDRVETIIITLSKLGAKVYEENNTLIIEGNEHKKNTATGAFTGGTVSSFNDHRIAMSAAIAAICSSEPVTIKDAMAVSKSYPNFYTELEKIL